MHISFEGQNFMLSKNLAVLWKMLVAIISLQPYSFFHNRKFQGSTKVIFKHRLNLQISKKSANLGLI